MPHMHIVIGDANTRKSSLLRCLTGVSGGRNAQQTMDVALTNGTLISVHCTTSALQESLNPQTPAQFMAQVSAMNPIPSHIAIALRVRSRAIYPLAQAYLQAFAAAGWPVESVALLGPSACALGPLAHVPRVAAIPHSPTRPTNETAQQVRQAWGWI